MKLFFCLIFCFIITNQALAETPKNMGDRRISSSDTIVIQNNSYQVVNNVVVACVSTPPEKNQTPYESTIDMDCFDQAAAAGPDSVSISTIKGYLDSCRTQVKHGCKLKASNANAKCTQRATSFTADTAPSLLQTLRSACDDQFYMCN